MWGIIVWRRGSLAARRTWGTAERLLWDTLSRTRPVSRPILAKVARAVGLTVLACAKGRGSSSPVSRRPRLRGLVRSARAAPEAAARAL